MLSRNSRSPRRLRKRKIKACCFTHLRKRPPTWYGTGLCSYEQYYRTLSTIQYTSGRLLVAPTNLVNILVPQPSHGSAVLRAGLLWLFPLLPTHGCLYPDEAEIRAALGCGRAEGSTQRGRPPHPAVPYRNNTGRYCAAHSWLKRSQWPDGHARGTRRPSSSMAGTKPRDPAGIPQYQEDFG